MEYISLGRTGVQVGKLCLGCMMFGGSTNEEDSFEIIDRAINAGINLGDTEQTRNIQGWPNHPKERIKPGKFNSPHSIAADSSGNLYIVEWISGGRITKLELITS